MKKYIIASSVILALTVAILGILYIPFKNNKPINTIKTEINNYWYQYTDGFAFQYDDKFKQYDKPESPSIPYVITQSTKNLINPTYSLLHCMCYEGSEPEGIQVVFTIKLKRKNFIDWEIESIRKSDINFSFQESVDLVSKHDLTTTFPGKENYRITNYPPLTQSEVDANRKRREADEQKAEDVQSQNQRIKTTYEVIFNKYNQYEKLLKTDNLTPDQIVTNKIVADRQLTELQILLQQIQTQLDNNQSFTFSENNITLKPDQQTKDDITQFINEVTELQK